MSGDSPSEPEGHGVRLIAFYLPQFHPEPANDGHHGPGFTEWVHVAGARPLFRGHQQPVLPGELGFYDLRVPEVREAQAALARQYGISAFCWWHYWSLGRRLLERPFREVLESGAPDFPFCLGWANHRWATDRSGAPESIVVAQEYGGDDDHARHFAALEPAFHDPRYVRVGGAPLFYVFRPREVPDLPALVALWTKLAHQSGLPGIHFVGQWRGEAIRADETPWTALDALVVTRIVAAGYRRPLRLRIVDRLRHGPIRLPSDAYAALGPNSCRGARRATPACSRTGTTRPVGDAAVTCSSIPTPTISPSTYVRRCDSLPIVHPTSGSPSSRVGTSGPKATIWSQIAGTVADGWRPSWPAWPSHPVDRHDTDGAARPARQHWHGGRPSPRHERSACGGEPAGFVPG